jgi:hypothetical protein
MSFSDATLADARRRVRPVHFCSLQEDQCGAMRGSGVMADALKRYWFVAAVFREPLELVATIAELRANGFVGNRLLIVANHGAEKTRKVVLGADVGAVPVVAMHTDGSGNVGASFGLPMGLRMLLDAIEASPSGRAAAPDGGGQSHVYAQLRQDVAEGAILLFASVADPEEQLLGARVLLRGNSECVLTHEIAAHIA